MKTISVAIPCRSLKVQVHLGPADGLSLMEQFALRTIAASANTEEKLRQSLALPPRVSLDLCVDLLRAGFITLERSSGMMVLSESVRQEIGDPAHPTEGWARRLASLRPPDPREYVLFQELVSGAVFHATREATQPPPLLYAPENDQLPLIEEIPKAQLMVAVASALRSRYSSGEEDLSSAEQMIASSLLRQRVLDATVHGASDVGGLAGANAQRRRVVVELRALPGAQEDGPPDLRVVGPATLPASVRRGIALGLRQLWDRGIARDKNQFFVRLPLDEKSGAQEAVARSIHPALSVSELESALKDLADPTTLPQEELLQMHTQLSSLEQNAAEEVSEGRSYRADTHLVVGAAAHHELLLRALREARQQTVLAGPWLGQLEQSEPLRMAILDAVTRGVQVHLLWGIDHKAQAQQCIPPRLRELMELTRPDGQRPGALYVPDRSCAVHAKFIVCDMSWALVTSCNFLNSGPERSALEIGLKLELPDKQAAVPEGAMEEWSAVDERPETPRALISILSWARTLLPDFRLQRALNDDPTLFGRRATAAPVALGGKVRPPSPQPSSAQSTLRGTLSPEKAMALARGIWHDGWKQSLASLKKELLQVRGAAIPTFDAEHRQLLLEAFASARERIVISSKTLGSGVLGSVPVEELHKALERGVKVTLVFNDEWDAGGDYGARRDKLEASGARLLNRNVHAKILVCDDWAIVSSFNFLSFEGYYDNEHRARHELGVRVLDRALTDELIAQLERDPQRAGASTQTTA
ncbi:phospholipase D-like domain-containing protein [Stigmatella aurantiaca]|uniref:GPCR, rhodopsin-like family protein n=1 Tax=Stigmatella aurantiaca (strain DW4/3-1) TaxID=378806 RepID=Q08NG0_STIAD|nr:phospholipase D-like domain-containing protein [Stigmatella aurantiaca]ADO70222.1 GPCR, rhodopsin-like family protein [Stigmatella aurantiaca DW4/3-1]EAU62018.1 hypothetical protein STIAU_1321 [Stigmatella aurantiaca DW4/3-1]